ncbi:hypothetical protein J6590_014878 [Homalodisca vitripennis]|nr:hypothetical protein J6590_014878 [Homalodisca vitripennis]
MNGTDLQGSGLRTRSEVRFVCGLRKYDRGTDLQGSGLRTRSEVRFVCGLRKYDHGTDLQGSGLRTRSEVRFVCGLRKYDHVGVLSMSDNCALCTSCLVHRALTCRDLGSELGLKCGSFVGTLYRQHDRVALGREGDLTPPGKYNTFISQSKGCGQTLFLESIQFTTRKGREAQLFTCRIVYDRGHNLKH